MKSLPEQIQDEVARLRETIAETKRLFQLSLISWVFYDAAISEAERAVREQDTVAMIKILPELKSME